MRLFRRVVPADLRDILGQREIVRSLGPSTPGEARALGHRLWSATEVLFMSLRLNPGLSKVEIQAFSAELLDNLRFDAEKDLASIEVAADRPTFPVVFKAQAYEMDAETVRAALARNDLALGRALLEEHFGDAALELSEDDARLLARAAMRVRGQADEEAARRIRDEVLPHLPEDAAYGRTGRPPIAAVEAPAAPSDPAPSKLRNAATPFSSLWPQYVADRIATNAWSPPIARQNESSRRLFVSVCGDKPMGAYGPLDGSDFRRTLLGLPVLYDKATAYRELYQAGDFIGIAAAVAAANGDAVDGAKVPTLNNKTFNRHFSALNPMWAFAKRVEALPKDAASIFDDLFLANVKVKDGGIRAFEQRPMWTTRALEAILAAPLFHGCLSRRFCRIEGAFVFRDERYWGILLGLHTGMRREEIFQLEVRHVYCDDETGIWHVDLYTQGLRLKDSGSPRFVPLHENLIALGFLAERVMGRQPGEMLFPEAKRSASDGRWGDLFGKWFGLWRRFYGVPDDMDFHGFRHTVATLLVRSGCSIPFAEEFIGHESAGRRSEFGRYNKGQTLRILKDAIDKVVFPVDVEVLNAAATKGMPQTVDGASD